MDQNKNNIYDHLLILLIVSLSFGFFRGIFAVPSYFFTALCFPLVLSETVHPKIETLRPILLAVLALSLYSIISLIWSPDLAKSTTALFILMRNLALFMDVVILANRANNPIRSLVNGWTYVFAITAVIALWEIITDSHLTIARESRDSSFLESQSTIRHTASVTFYNPNTYCVFMVMSLPMLLYKITFVEHTIEKTTQISLLLLIVFIMFMNASRGGLISMTIILIVFLYFSMKSGPGEMNNKSNLLLLFISFFILFLFFSTILLEAIVYRLGNIGLLEDQARMVLWKSSWASFIDSNGLGNGIGSMKSVLEGSSLNTTSIIYSHNLLLESLVEGGVVYFSFISFFLYKLFKYAQTLESNGHKMVVYSILFAFPVYSVINSQYIPVMFVWCFFASVYVIASYQYSVEENY